VPLRCARARSNHPRGKRFISRGAMPCNPWPDSAGACAAHVRHKFARTCVVAAKPRSTGRTVPVQQTTPARRRRWLSQQRMVPRTQRVCPCHATGAVQRGLYAVCDRPVRPEIQASEPGLDRRVRGLVRGVHGALSGHGLHGHGRAARGGWLDERTGCVAVEHVRERRSPRSAIADAVHRGTQVLRARL
jgi:hypothetical protein